MQAFYGLDPDWSKDTQFQWPTPSQSVQQCQCLTAPPPLPHTHPLQSSAALEYTWLKALPQLVISENHQEPSRGSLQELVRLCTL